MSPLKRKKKKTFKKRNLLDGICRCVQPKRNEFKFFFSPLFSLILIIFWRGGGGLTTAKRKNFKNRKRQKKNQSIITATIFIF
jgi:hypothetical protein